MQTIKRLKDEPKQQAFRQFQLLRSHLDDLDYQQLNGLQYLKDN